MYDDDLGRDESNLEDSMAIWGLWGLISTIVVVALAGILAHAISVGFM